MTTEKQKIRAKASRRGRTTSPGKTTRSAEITPSEKKKYSPSKNISPKSSKSPPSSNSTKNSENRSPKRPSPPPEQDEGPVEPEQKRHKSKKPAPLPASPTAPSPTLPRQASLEPKEKGIEAIQRELDDVVSLGLHARCFCTTNERNPIVLAAAVMAVSRSELSWGNEEPRAMVLPPGHAAGSGAHSTSPELPVGEV